MVVINKKVEKICSFYASDFHLEMMLLPYINKGIDEKQKIKIVTEKNLENSMKILVSKVNLNDDKREEILNLGWNKSEIGEINNSSNIILVGTQDFIDNKHKEIMEKQFDNAKIIDCYNIEEVNGNMQNIINQHDKSLNTLGISTN